MLLALGLQNKMRLLFALVYISFGMWCYFQFGGDTLHPNIGMVVLAALFLSSVVVCNEGFFRMLRGVSYEEHLDELLKNNKAIIEKYTVRNSLVFDDLGTGCNAYLLDVGNKEIICLHGQDYGFEPIDDEPELNQERQFPTEKFSLVRVLKNQEIHHVRPEGRVY